MKTKSLIACGLALAGFALCPAVRADEVTDWNANMLTAFRTANVSPLVASRSAALVSAAVYDALNGIERRYEPIHVAANAPPEASRRAAAVQAAYAMLVKLFPAQRPNLDFQLTASLAGIVSEEAVENSQSMLRGIDWGQAVADAIWAWRSTDGFTTAPPSFPGGVADGQWRPTPPAFLPAAGLQFAYMTPWAMNSRSQFRPDGPPALASDQYAADFDETRLMGSASSLLRTADQTLACQFWGVGGTATYLWNHLAVSLATERHHTLSENARLLALLNIAIADAAIACWEAKYTYAFWRPITTIPLTEPGWTTLLVTPNHPEYPSGHSTLSGAAAAVLADHFGDDTSLTFDSDVLLGVTRSFSSFSAALDEIKEARIFAGIHFRTACEDGQTTGANVANYILENSFRRLHGE